MSMAKKKLPYALIQRIFVLLLVTTSLIMGTTAESKQQSVFLDAKGNPIPNDILLSLGSSGKVRTPKAKGTSPSFKKVTQVKIKKKELKSTPELERELLESLLAGRTARASQLVQAGVKVNYKNYKGETPLSVSVDRGWGSMVIDLLEHGGKLNQKNALGLSLLHHASSKGYTDLAKLLIRQGLNPSSKTSKNWNSLHIAARYGHWQLVQFYLNMGVDPNDRTSDGKTALEIAQIVRHQGIVKALSRVTTARPIGRAANYDRRYNRKKYDKLEASKRAKVAQKRAVLYELESIKQAKLAHKRAILKEKRAIIWRQKNGKCGPNNIYCIPKLTEE